MPVPPEPIERTMVAGIDVGSSAIKSVILDIPEEPAAPRILAAEVGRIRRRDPRRTAVETFERCLVRSGLRRDALDYIATTGEGEMIPFRTGHFYGMTTHARGGLFLAPSARAVLDIGALHTRAVMMDDRARVLSLRMTSQCASGSGQFLENISRYLGITIDEIGPLSLEGTAPETCSSICAVLAETDVINMVSRGISTPNIIRGIHESMAGRYLRLVASLGVRGKVLVTGGLAADIGLLDALNRTAEAKRSGFEFISDPRSILAGAIGAALWGGFRARKLAARGGLALAGGGA